MHHSFRSYRDDFVRIAILGSLACTVLLTGCALGTAAFPDTPPATEQVPMPPIQGSNFGGHAPIVGAHVFVLQAGTGGYGSKATSAITTAGLTTTDYYGSVYTTTLDNTPGSPTNGMYYVTTDARGDFALSGDYTCTAGLPVYLYASGGNPETNPTGGFAVSVTGASAAPDVNGNLLVTFTTTGNQLLYQGEQVNFNNFTGGGAYSGFANSTQTVSPIGLTTSTFGVELGASSSSVAYQAFNATVTQNTPIVSNPAIVNIALLGNCPGSITFAGIPDGTSTNTLTGVSPADLAKLAVGNVVLGPGIYNATITGINSSTGTITFNQADTGGNPAGPFYTYTSSSSAANNFSYLNFVYMNEVSTAAAMTALAPFASSTANDAVHIGTSSTNLAGLQHAVLNAANLYDIQGSNQGTGGDGDTHIARAVTPTNSGGTVPQSLLNLLGNLLANCVDSANTYNAATASSGTQSTQCATLMNTATSDGTTTGTRPNDTATAMINIAHHPSGATSNPNFVSSLFNSITGNAPFQPTMSGVPNDFSVGISFSGNGLASPGNVAIDASGDAWLTGNSNVVELAPNGAPLSGSTGFATAAYQNRAPVIDSSGNVWFISVTGSFSGYVNKMSSSGALLSGSGYDSQSAIEPYSLAVDANNNVWVANTQSTSAADNYAAYITELNQSGSVVQTVNANPSFSATGGGNVLLGPNGIALDGNGLLWIDGSASGNVASINTSSGSVAWYTNTSSTASNDPEFLAIDQNNKLWVPNLNTNFIQTVTPSAATSTGSNTYSYSYQTYTGGGLTGGSAAAVDGANNIWVMGNNQKYVSEFNSSGTALTGAGGYAGGFGSSGGNRLAIDGSGDVWMPIAGGNSVIEMVGVATPVVTPQVTAAKTGTPGKLP